jgi:hypothetical protein
MITLLAFVVLICKGLGHNQRRQIRTTSYNGVPDRDLERLVSDLRAIS